MTDDEFREIAARIKDYVRIKGGGDVQRAFGQSQAADDKPADIVVSGGLRMRPMTGGVPNG